MADQETTQPASGDAGNEQAGKPRLYTDEEVNAILARKLKPIEAKAKTAEQALAEEREARQSEAERALNAKLKERDMQWEGRLLQKEIDGELKVKLLERGLPANAAVLVKNEHNIDSIEAIADAIDATLKANEWLKPIRALVQAQGGAPRQSPGERTPWSTSTLNAFLTNHPTKYKEIAAEVEADRQANRFVYD